MRPGSEAKPVPKEKVRLEFCGGWSEPSPRLLSLTLGRAGCSSLPTVVPAEASSAFGALLLKNSGILTVNVSGMPGARVSLRLKPTPEQIAKVGGVPGVVDAADATFNELAKLIDKPAMICNLVLGDD
jgi:L-seryl-tRNA(Ser) seleniumtransferase